MTRTPLAALAALLLATPAFGQGFSRPPGAPLAPSGRGFFAPYALPRAVYPQFNPLVPGGAAYPLNIGGITPLTQGFVGFGGYTPGYSGLGYGFSPYATPYAFNLTSFGQPALPAVDLGVPPPLLGAGGGTAPAPAAAPSGAGEITLDFPSEVALTVDGQALAQTGLRRTVTTRALRPGESVSVKLAAAWTADGVDYEWDKTLDVSAGQKLSVTVARGDRAKGK